MAAPRWSVDIAERLMYGPDDDGEWHELWDMAPGIDERAFVALVRNFETLTKARLYAHRLRRMRDEVPPEVGELFDLLTEEAM